MFHRIFFQQIAQLGKGVGETMKEFKNDTKDRKEENQTKNEKMQTFRKQNFTGKLLKPSKVM